MPAELPAPGGFQPVYQLDSPPLPLSLHLLLGAVGVILALYLGYAAISSQDVIPFDVSRPTHLLVLAGFLVGSLFLLKQPEVGLLLLVVMVYSNSSEVAVRYHGWPSPLQALTAALAAVIVAHGVVAGRHRPRGGLLLFLMGLFGLVILITSARAANPLLADEKLLEHLKGLLIFVAVFSLVRSRETLQRAVWAVVAVGAALGTISLFQVLTSSYTWDFGGFGRIKFAQIFGEVWEPRIAGPVSDPNFYAQILVPVIPLALYRLRDKISRPMRLAAAYALMACLLALLFTYSRGGILALGVVLGLALLLERANWKHCGAALALLAAVLLVAPQELERRVGTLAQFVAEEDAPVADLDTSMQQRALLMRVAWEAWGDYPWLGVGAGNYSEHYQQYAERIGSPVSSYEDFDRRRFAHSLYLETAAETGLAGLLVFGAILIVAGGKGLQAIRDFRRTGENVTASLVLSLLLGVVGYLTAALFLHGHYLRHLWLLLGLVAASAHVAREEAGKASEGVAWEPH